MCKNLGLWEFKGLMQSNYPSVELSTLNLYLDEIKMAEDTYGKTLIKGLVSIFLPLTCFPEANLVGYDKYLQKKCPI